MDQHCYATVIRYVGKQQSDVVVDALARLTSVRAMSGGGGSGLLGCSGSSGSFLGRHLGCSGVIELMDGWSEY